MRRVPLLMLKSALVVELPLVSVSDQTSAELLFCVTPIAFQATPQSSSVSVPLPRKPLSIEGIRPVPALPPGTATRDGFFASMRAAW